MEGVGRRAAYGIKLVSLVFRAKLLKLTILPVRLQNPRRPTGFQSPFSPFCIWDAFPPAAQRRRRVDYREVVGSGLATLARTRGQGRFCCRSKGVERVDHLACTVKGIDPGMEVRAPSSPLSRSLEREGLSQTSVQNTLLRRAPSSLIRQIDKRQLPLLSSSAPLRLRFLLKSASRRTRLLLIH
jgi:hypothetical protein